MPIGHERGSDNHLTGRFIPRASTMDGNIPDSVHIHRYGDRHTGNGTLGGAIRLSASIRLRRPSGRLGWNILSHGFAIPPVPIALYRTFCVGIYQSGTNYYRYAAADSMPGKESKAINGILSAGAIASIIGPVLATFFGTATSIEYEGSYYVVSVLAACAVIVLLVLPKIQSPTPSHMRDKAIASTTPNYPALLTRPRFVLGATISFVASFVMVLVMSGAPIVLESTFSQNAQTRMVAMQLHMVGMYLPTLFAIFIFHKKNSEMAQALTGLIVGMLGTVVALAASASYAVTLDLLLIGISWSLCYAAGSALLTKSYAESERSWARGVGELAPVLGQVLGSVLAGVLLAAGWKTVFVTVLAMIVCALIAMAGYRNKIKS